MKMLYAGAFLTAALVQLLASTLAYSDGTDPLLIYSLRGAGQSLEGVKIGFPCQDDSSFEFQDSTDQTCAAWVAADPGARCDLPVFDGAPEVQANVTVLEDFCHAACAYVTTSRDVEADACTVDGVAGVKYVQCTANNGAGDDIPTFREQSGPAPGTWADTGYCSIEYIEPKKETPYAEGLFEYLTTYTPLMLTKISSPQYKAMTWIAARGIPLDDPFLLDTYVMAVLAFHWKFVDYYHLHPQQKRPVAIYTGHPTTSPTGHPTGDPQLTVDLQESQPITTYESYRAHMNSPPPPRVNGGRGSYRGSLGNRRTQTAAGFGIYCTWPNVNCNSKGMVHDIDLGEMGLDGTIPHEIGYLTEMEQLDLSRNRLTGHVPSQSSGGNMSSAVRPPYFASLSALILSENRLVGPVPTDMGSSAPRLARLDLDHNALTGPLPGSIFSLTGLTRLNLHRNFLTGTLSRDVGRLKRLRFLSLYENQFGGTVPQELGGLSNLEGLYLDHNMLTGRCGEDLCRNVKLAGGSLEHLAVDCERVQCTCATECASEM